MSPPARGSRDHMMQGLHVQGADYNDAILPALAREGAGSAGPRAFLLVLLLMAPFAAAPAAPVMPCATASASAALAARALQTDLMVAALVCERRDDYNDFVRRHRPTLATYGRALRAWFTQQYGLGGETQLNRFVTRLANEASRASNLDRAQYCRSVGTLYDGLVDADEPGLEAVIRQPLLAVRHGVAACGAAATRGAAAEFSARP